MCRSASYGCTLDCCPPRAAPQRTSGAATQSLSRGTRAWHWPYLPANLGDASLSLAWDQKRTLVATKGSESSIRLLTRALALWQTSSPSPYTHLCLQTLQPLTLFLLSIEQRMIEVLNIAIVYLFHDHLPSPEIKFSTLALQVSPSHG